MIGYLHWLAGWPTRYDHRHTCGLAPREYADLLWWQMDAEYGRGWPCWISPRSTG